jgi:hypothetical protein
MMTPAPLAQPRSRTFREAQNNPMDSHVDRKQIRWNPRPRTRAGLHLKTEKLPYQRPVIAQSQFTASAIMVAERMDVRACRASRSSPNRPSW